jgi:hypothetical protein
MVNMSLDDIINNQRRNKRNLQIVKSTRTDPPLNYNRKNGENNFRRRNFNRRNLSRNENDDRDATRISRGRDSNMNTRIGMRRNDNFNRNSTRRYNNFDNNRDDDNKVGI